MKWCDCMNKDELDLLIDKYRTNVKHHMKEISKPSGIIANYMLDIAKRMEEKENVTEKDIVYEISDFAWDLSPWFKDSYPYKFFEVYSYYEAYNKLSHQEKEYIKKNK